jgi:signal-transduction protein with cAMP-binding, CBS, and nucleotidyltransferase domain
MSYQTDSIQFETKVPVREIMRTNPKTIDYHATVEKAAQKMCSKDPSGSCIVLKENIAVGIVTEQDINCKVVARDLRPSEVHVNEIMTSPLITITTDKTVEEAAHLMIRNRVRRLPIVNDKGIVIGIVSVRDIVAVNTEINELMSELIVINKAFEFSSGMCSRCGKMSDELVSADGSLICPDCLEDDRL